MSDNDPKSMHELERQRSGGLRKMPMAYDNGAGERVEANADICSVTEADIRRFSSGGHVCGECRFFEQGHAMAEMARQNFVRELVKDYEWNPAHAGMTTEKASEIGLCADAGDMATSKMTAACENFRENRGRIKKEATATQQRIVVNDMRAGAQDHAERFEAFKAKNRQEDADG